MPGPRFHSILVAIVAASLLAGCTPTNKAGVYYASGKEAVTPDGLHRILWEPFTVSFVKPGAKLGGYESVLVDEVTVSFKRPPRSYGLSPSAIANMRKTFQEAFEKALTQSKNYTLAQKPGPRTLRIAGHIVDLTISAPPENQQPDDATLFVASTGAITLILNVEDSETGAPLVRVGERHSISLFNDEDESYQADNESTSAALTNLFESWAAELTRELDQLGRLPEIPEDHQKHEN
jgi:hypothetical protein